MTVVPIQNNGQDDLDEIERAVATGLDFNERFVRKAFEKFRDRRREALAEPVDEESVLGPITSEAIKEAVITAWIEDVRHGAAKMVLAVREAALDASARQMKLAILEHEDVDPENPPRLDIHRFLLVKPREEEDSEEDSPELIERYRKLLAFVGALAKGVAPEVLEGLKEGQVPDQFANEDGTEVFLSDLAEFLVDAGEDRFEVLNAILEDADVALKVVEDDDVPKPLRYVAFVTVKVRNAEKARN